MRPFGRRYPPTPSRLTAPARRHPPSPSARGIPSRVLIANLTSSADSMGFFRCRPMRTITTDAGFWQSQFFVALLCPLGAPQPPSTRRLYRRTPVSTPSIIPGSPIARKNTPLFLFISPRRCPPVRPPNRPSQPPSPPLPLTILRFVILLIKCRNSALCVSQGIMILIIRRDSFVRSFERVPMRKAIINRMLINSKRR